MAHFLSFSDFELAPMSLLSKLSTLQVEGKAELILETH